MLCCPQKECLPRPSALLGLQGKCFGNCVSQNLGLHLHPFSVVVGRAWFLSADRAVGVNSPAFFRDRRVQVYHRDTRNHNFKCNRVHVFHHSVILQPARHKRGGGDPHQLRLQCHQPVKNIGQLVLVELFAVHRIRHVMEAKVESN